MTRNALLTNNNNKKKTRMDLRRGKRAVVVLSSSESDSEEQEQDDDNRDELEDYTSDEDYDHADQAESSESDATDDNDNEEEEEEEESLGNKVIALLREGKDIESLKLRQCKAYLRKHGLRISGTRAVCVARIREHWRLKDGSGYTLYPRSSFTINCTGDVCKGDVVVFRQKVYEKFDKVSRHGRVLGSRTVAGRVVKESYGAAKQQHTFTVEVLWSSGVQKLPPLFPLLVKGRNLYKQRTYRQRWKNEADRVQVLSEKHGRGAAARSVRAMRQKKNSCYANGSKGSKRQHEIQKTGRSRKRRPFELDKVGHPDGCGRVTSFQPQEAIPSTLATGKENAPSRATRAWHKSAEFDCYQVPMHHPLYVPYEQSSHPSQINFQMRNDPSKFFHYERGRISNIAGFPSFRPHAGEFTSRSRPPVPSDIHQYHARTNPGYNFEMMNLNADNVDRPLQLPPRTMYGRRNYGL